MTKQSITTKQGDKGQSSLYSGERVSKSDPRFAVVGDIDELVSVLGIVRSKVDDPDIQSQLYRLQELLFVAGSRVATSHEHELPVRITKEDVALLDLWATTLEKKLPEPPGFAVPGATTEAAYLDLARTVARRCERGITMLIERDQVKAACLSQWFNRLSDLLWLMARNEEKGATNWKS